MLTSLSLLLCLGAGLIAGVFLAFSNFVMKALTEIPAEQGAAAMQRINVVVLNPLFLGIFVSAAILAAICIFVAFYPWGTVKSLLLLTAGLSYLIGSFGVTAAFNVPLNEHLAGLSPESVETATYWPVYVREWLMWNHVRTVASVVSAASAALALAY
ncbi:DUF1772 domain-containing protein [Synechococcus sp. PCC 6312]|uniref:anthrone oxygenase family protein n=1 Tax=Synechococcus sp. (strain ATCC 27167 / PCC 6312) TaxID=195253 RepID=UPI00029F4D17|nr:anthrone oxygenase family protein [Synechococcus sp. PCC 6312]AFY60049.1 putative integral membrane protein [Synechococcus sp. PCC 6312]